MAARKPVPEMPVGLYTAHFFIKVVRECEILGVAAERLLHGAGIEHERLHDAATRVTLKQTLRLAGNALRLCDRPDLGLYLGTRTQTNDGGLVSVAAIASGKFWEKAQLNERYHRLSGQIMTPYWRKEGSLQVYRLHAPEDLSELTPFFVEEGFSTLLTVIKQNCQTAFVPSEVRLAYGPPPHQSRYGALFGCPVRFNALHNEFVGNFRALPVSRRSAHPLNFRLYQRLCEEMDPRAGIVEQVKSLLLQQGEALTMRDLASRLGMTSRTLARRLGSQGRSYQDVKDQVRLDKATQLLRHTQMSVSGIAEATGFRSVRRFRNFFTRHQGEAPSHYRKRGVSP
jgi:AraC-like DNA-binding protein